MPTNKPHLILGSSSLSLTITESSTHNYYHLDNDIQDNISDINIEISADNVQILYNLGIYIKNSTKSYNFNIINNGNNSKISVNIFAIVDTNGDLFVSGDEAVLTKNIFATIDQSIKVTLLDKSSKVKCLPILKVHSYNVIGNHANSIGLLPLDDTFYLTSRGLSREDIVTLLIHAMPKRVLKDAVLSKKQLNELNKYIGVNYE